MLNELQKQLNDVSQDLIKDNLYPGEILALVNNYKKLLFDSVSFNEGAIEAQIDISTHSGRAIAPKWAGMYINDYLRTYRFCKAIFKATKDVIEKEGKAHILYAGTGPFASLVLPLTYFFTNEQLKFTLLEIHEHNYSKLQHVIKKFELEGYVEDIVCCDAAEYTIENPKSINILLSETMMNALKDEHQVAITYNLLNQLSEKTILIPEKIELALLAVNEDIYDANKKSLDEPQAYFDKLGSLFTLNKKTVFDNKDHFNNAFPTVTFKEVITTVPEETNQNFNTLSIATIITIYKDIGLDIDDSALTQLQKLIDLNPMLQTVTQLKSNYKCGRKPGLQFKITN